jgi:hypothetical protein
MKLTIVGGNSPDQKESEIETLFVTAAQNAYLGRQSQALNPDMPVEFGAAHVIRTLLERMEEAGVDAGGASEEEEVTRMAVARLRRGGKSQQDR